MKTSALHTDILIAGGGIAGVCCALAAARTGVRVILCQDRPVLGGNASSEIRMHMVGANGFGRHDRGRALEVEAREGGIVEEIRLENCVRNPQRSPSMFDLILYDLCRRESNLRLLLNTTVTGAVVDAAPPPRHSARHGEDAAEILLKQVRAERPSTEEAFQITAQVFVDCTGDGRLGLEAGAPFMEGRESREQFGESLAQDRADGKRLGSSIMMQARRHDRPMPFEAPAWVRQFSKEDLRLRLYAEPPGDEEPTFEYGFWWAEWGGHLDTIRENETIRDELLAIVLGIWKHIKDNDPRAANWALEWFGFVPGKRESRRFIGRHVLTQQDVLESRPFADAIAYGGWPMDLHPPEGVDRKDEPACVQHAVPHLYDIPLAMCVSRDVSNLMFAGRNVSATHVAFASTRVMATCGVIGQGVGTAAAEAVRLGVTPAVLRNDPAAISRVQQAILRNDGYLIGLRNEDLDDLARRATVTASSAQRGGEAVNVLSGQTRSVQGPRGAPPARELPGLHRWMSDPVLGLPAWIELAWEQPVEIGSVVLIFDTGLHRHVTLTQHDGYAARMIWGRAQPETVRDYTLEAQTDSGWQRLLNVGENYHRRREHRLERPVMTRALRLRVTTTNGLDHARVCEIRIHNHLDCRRTEGRRTQ